jgi:hypothetical protein
MDHAWPVNSTAAVAFVTRLSPVLGVGGSPQRHYIVPYLAPAEIKPQPSHSHLHPHFTKKNNATP